MNLQVGVKVIIKNSDDEILLIRRSDVLDQEMVYWDIPGGRINPEERLQQALEREVYEETGIRQINNPILIAAQDIFVESKNLHVVRLTYTVTVSDVNVVLSKEHTAYQWTEIENIAALDVDPYINEVLEKELLKK